MKLKTRLIWLIFTYGITIIFLCFSLRRTLDEEKRRYCQIFDNKILLKPNKECLDVLLRMPFYLNFSDVNNTKVGLEFNVQWNAYLYYLNLLKINVDDDATVLDSTPIIGTAFSSNHFHESSILFNSLKRMNKTRVVYVYDLGLTPEQRKLVETDHGSVIAQIRNFPFDIYPSYISNLHEYRWKPLVIAQLLSEFPSMWWMDTSVEVRKPLEHYYPFVRQCINLTSSSMCPHYPWFLMPFTGHSINAATHPYMYKFLPVPEEAKNMSMYGATVQLIFGTKEVRENVLRYWILCALERNCMAPVGSNLPCKFGINRFSDYANCHRFDQSAINLILARVNEFNESRYTNLDVGYLEVVRGK